MKSAKTQGLKNVVSVHLRNTTTSNKTVRIIHMPTREEAIRLFIRFLRNHNNLVDHITPLSTLKTAWNNDAKFFEAARKYHEIARTYWSFWDNDSVKYFTAYANTDKRHFTHDDIHLFNTLSDSWRD